MVDRLRAAVESTGAAGFGAFAGLHPLDGTAVVVGDTRVTFLGGGPEGRPELYGERFA